MAPQARGAQPCRLRDTASDPPDMIENPVAVHFNGRAWAWLWRWTSDTAIRGALSEAEKRGWGGGRGFRAYVRLTPSQARLIISQLDEWEDLRRSGKLAKDPTDYDKLLFTNAKTHILDSLANS